MALPCPDERERLIEPDSGSCSQTDDADVDGRSPFHFRLSKLAKYCLLLEFLLELSNNILTVPLISLFERAICEAYFGDQDPNISSALSHIDEASCKIPYIQSELAKLRGWKGFFEILSAMLVAVPVGHIADRVSHRKVFAVILSGMLAALLWTILVATQEGLPLRLIWCSSVFYLCGGGYYAAEMMTSVMIAAACSERDRTRTFYFAYAAFVSTELIGPPLASVTSRLSVWTPIAIGVAALLSCYAVLMLMPEPQREGATSERAVQEPDFSPSSTSLKTMKQTVQEVYGTWPKLRILDLFKSRNMILAFPVFMVGVFRGVSLRVLLQYTSVRFGWKLSQTNAIISEVALVNLGLFFLALPTLLGLLKFYTPLSTQEINLRIVQYSLMILVLGSVLLALAPSSIVLLISVAIYATGFGARTTLLSLVTTWFAKDLRARLYSTIFLIEQLGMLIGEPLLQSIFALALQLPQFWLGLPFVCSGTCFLAAFLFSLCIRVDM